MSLSCCMEVGGHALEGPEQTDQYMKESHGHVLQFPFIGTVKALCKSAEVEQRGRTLNVVKRL